MSASEIFQAALQLPPEQRQDFLDEACRGNPDLRREVELLLQAQDTTNGPLTSDPAAISSTSNFEPIAEQPGSVIGPYKIMEQIGEGGFGLVFVAEQQRPIRRKVALKIIKPGMDTREIVARFEMERQALALMDHPNIARVFDGGATASGRPYFVMELVKGIPIVAYCDQQRLGPRERLELFVTVCQAAQHAHAKGIIHRDLKPSNILVAPHDGLPVVKVIDFGVAKAIGQQLTDKTIYTRFAQMIGTPLYMSPEQAEVNALDVDIRSDVYSLGVLLYELLTGTTPFDPQRLQRAAYDEIRRIIREEDPPKPSTRLSSMGELLSTVSSQRRTEPAALSALVKGDLDWIVMKCLEKERSRRYETAIGLAKDVQRYLVDEPIEARPPSMAYRARKFVHRHRWPVFTAFGVVALLVLGMAGTLNGLIAARRAAQRASDAELAAVRDRDQTEKARQAEERARRTAQRERDEAQKARDELRFALYRADMNLLQAAWAANNVSRVLQILDAHRPRDGSMDVRAFEWHYWNRLCNGELLISQLEFGPKSPVARSDFAAFNALGDRCAAIVAQDAGQPDSFVVKVWETQGGKLLFSWPLPKGKGLRQMLAFSGNGERLAIAGEDNRIAVWNLVERKELAVVSVADEPALPGRSSRSLRPLLSHDGRRLAAFAPPISSNRGNSRPPAVKVWDIDDGTDRPLFHHVGLSESTTLSPDGLHLATVALKMSDEQAFHWELRLLNAATGDVVSTTAWPKPTAVKTQGPSHEDTTTLIYSPDGTRLAAMQRRWDRVEGTPSDEGVIFDGQGKVIAEFRPDFPVGYQTFAPDGSRLATWFGGRDPFGVVWDTTSGKSVQTLKGHATPVVATSFMNDGNRLAAVDLDGILRVWDATETSIRRSQSSRDTASVWSMDGSRQALYSRRTNEPISIRDSAGKEVATLPGHSAPVVTAQFSFDGRFLISVDSNGGVKVWEITTRTARIDQLWQVGERTRTMLTFCATGNRLFVPLLGSGCKVWEVVPQAKELLSCELAIHSISLSDRGHRLAMLVETGDRLNRELIVWDVDSQAKRSLGHGRFEQVLLSSDGTFVAVQQTAPGPPVWPPSRQGPVEILVWNTETGEQRPRLIGNIGLGAMAFSPDAHWLATVTPTTVAATLGNILLWDLSSGTLRQELRGHATTPFGLAFSPDGRRLASSGQPMNSPQGELRLWDLPSGAEVLQAEMGGMLTSRQLLRFSDDGWRIFAMSRTGFEVWQQSWNATPRVEGDGK